MAVVQRMLMVASAFLCVVESDTGCFSFESLAFYYKAKFGSLSMESPAALFLFLGQAFGLAARFFFRGRVHRMVGEGCA